jgi:hypothetical protein
MGLTGNAGMKGQGDGGAGALGGTANVWKGIVRWHW